MKLKQTLLGLCAFIMLTFTSKINAQVTVGSTEKPVAGALLELKNIDGITDGSANATKGLGLPRLKLITLTSISDISNAKTKEKEHTGLVVYNTSGELNPVCANIYDGLYVWDGEKWNLIPERKNGANVHEFVDSRDGEVYPYSSFGNAGIWMLENMRATEYGERTDPSEVISELKNTGAYTNTLEPRWGYPNPKDFTNASDNNYYIRNKRFGLLYNYYGATNNIGKSSAGDSDQGNNPNAPQIQGICPKGWHLPSDYEWLKLEEEIIKYTDKYTSLSAAIDPTGTNVNLLAFDINDASTDMRGKHGLAFKSQCAPPYPSQNPADLLLYGVSYPREQGGFAVEFASAAHGGVIRYDDSLGYMWTSSWYGGGNAWRRAFARDKGVVGRYTLSTNWYFAIRCKKDN